MLLNQPPIIVIKKKKHAAHAHHGGSWKVAYADFVTAMMAFFLLMWLLGNTTEGQRAAIADYFENPSAVEGSGGASTSMIDMGGSAEPAEAADTSASNDEEKESAEERRKLDSLRELLEEAVEKSQALKPFKDQLLIDIMPEGLRIQIVDKENRPMFDRSSSTLKSYTRKILRELGASIAVVPNRVSISGHTDAVVYRYHKIYSNWELSADRANAARRELIRGGMEPNQIGRVVGLASSVLFDKEKPYNPINRRVSIIVMNKATEDLLKRSESKKSVNVKRLGAELNAKPEPSKSAGRQPAKKSQDHHTH